MHEITNITRLNTFVVTIETISSSSSEHLSKYYLFPRLTSSNCLVLYFRTPSSLRLLLSLLLFLSVFSLIFATANHFTFYLTKVFEFSSGIINVPIFFYISCLNLRRYNRSCVSQCAFQCKWRYHSIAGRPIRINDC